MLHPVTQRETLVASGHYRYTRSSETLRGEERFSIHALKDGSWFVRVDYDWRALDGTSQLIEALLDPQAEGGRFQRIVAQLHSRSGITKETFDFHPQHVLVGVGGGGVPRRDIEVPLPEGYGVLMLKTALAGVGAARWPAEAGVTVAAFSGYRSERGKPVCFPTTYSDLGEETVTVGGATIRTRVMAFDGEFRQTLWVDENGVAVRREMGELVVTLHNYSRRVGGLS